MVCDCQYPLKERPAQQFRIRNKNSYWFLRNCVNNNISMPTRVDQSRDGLCAGCRRPDWLCDSLRWRCCRPRPPLWREQSGCDRALPAPHTPLREFKPITIGDKNFAKKQSIYDYNSKCNNISNDHDDNRRYWLLVTIGNNNMEKQQVLVDFAPSLMKLSTVQILAWVMFSMIFNVCSLPSTIKS